MDFFSLVRRLNWRFREEPARKRPGAKKRLGLERLESRELLAVAPFVTNVTPPAGATLGTEIVVSFSENVSGAGNPNNYKLFDGDGAPVSIGAVSYNPATFEATISASQLNGGNPLFAGTYALFLHGDRIVDTDDGLPVSPPGSLVVSNFGPGALSTVSLLGDGTLSSAVNQPMPQDASFPAPTAVALADVDFDGLDDLIVVNSAQDRVAIYQGTASGRYAADPSAELVLPSGSGGIAVAVADFDEDGADDIAVANSGTANVTVFLNTSLSVGTVSFATGASTAVGTGPNGMVVGDFTGDSNLDIAVSNGSVSGSNYVANVIAGRGDGTFLATVAVTVGTTTPSNLTNPTGIAVGRFNNDARDDLVVSGGTGISVLTSTGTGTTASFGAAFVASGATTSVAAGVFRSNAGSSTLDDVLATSSANGGTLLAYLNDGAGALTATGAVDAFADAPSSVELRDMDGDGEDDVVFVNANSSGGLHVQPPVQAGRIADATNADPIVITSLGHGLADGQQVTITGVAGNTNANGTFYIQNVTADSFELIGAAGNAAATANTGTWIANRGIITDVTGAGTAPIVVTSPNHGLQTGQQVTISGVQGNTAANGTFFVTRVNDDEFSLNGTSGNGGYTARTGVWQALPYATGSEPLDVAFGDVDGQLGEDAVTANRFDDNVTIYRGKSTGDFFTGTHLELAGGIASIPSDPLRADLNADGLIDLIAADSSGDSVDVFLALPEGGYGAPLSFSTITGGLGASPTGIVLGDLDRDGFLDVVAVSSAQNVVSVLAGNGDGTFDAADVFSVGRSPTEAVLADLNEDGELDLLVAHNGIGGATNRGVTVRMGNGDGTFAAASEIAVGTQSVGLVTADVNRDGNVDLLVLEDRAPGRVLRFLGNGSGGLRASGNFIVGPAPTDMTVADLNSDGYLDVVTVSGDDDTVNNVTVLLNSTGTGFRQALHTALPGGAALQSVEVFNLNDDAYLDLVVSTAGDSDNNVYLLTARGDGTFLEEVTSFGVTGSGTPFSLDPSAVSVLADPFIPLTTFLVGGTLVNTNVVINGGLELRDQTGEQGNLSGWATFKLKDETGGSAGGWSVQQGEVSPYSSVSVNGPTNGRFQAMLDQHDIGAFAGTHALYQDITIPAGATAANLSLRLYIDSFADWSFTSPTSSLDYRLGVANQQVRVDIMRPTAGPMDVSTGVLRNLFHTDAGQSTFQDRTLTSDLSAFAGQTVRLRVASVNNSGELIIGVDNVVVRTVVSDTEAPRLEGVTLRNRSFLSANTPLEQTTDPTLVGQVNDNVSINNIRQLEVDVRNDGFGTPDDIIISVFDAFGRFSVTLPEVPPGVNTINLRVIDKASNVVELPQPFSFILQGPSLATWQSAGPGPIDVSGQGVDYNTVSGKVTAVVADPRDPSGQTLFVGSANGGVWRSADGGRNWQAQTDNVTVTVGGQRLPVPIGALAVTDDGVIYAATGVEDIAFTSHSGVGILRSTNDGRSWDVLGADTFKGAQIAKMVVDPTDSDVVYVAVTAWDDPTKGPGVYKTTNGRARADLVDFDNVLLPENMFLPRQPGQPGRTVTLGAGTELASVTDLIIDPFNPERLIVGLGNIGKRSLNGTAGVWKSFDSGATWEKQVGGDNTTIQNSTLPQGTVVGRVTLAQGNGRVGDEDIVYVLMSTPGSATEFSQGGTLGLYKSKDNMLNFTKVMLRERDIFSATLRFADIDLHGTEGGKVGALAVDPNNPHVVYVGGSDRFYSGLRRHSLIRVDTGNMRDTSTIANDGDDADKRFEAFRAPNNGKYPSASGPGTGPDYTGEGVYWYDVIEAGSHGGGRERLPTSIQAISLDGQGRLLFATENGLFRGVPRNYDYDFTTGGEGIYSFSFAAPRPIGLAITELNGNLQIADLTSVAIDPRDRNRFYIGGSGFGSALTAGAQQGWESMGLNGLGGNSGSPTASLVRTASPSPNAAPDAETNVYRLWQYLGLPNALVPEVSTDSGLSFRQFAADNFKANDTAGREPVFATRSRKVLSDGVFYDELLFGTDRIYRTKTSGAVWDVISPEPLSQTGDLSALAIAPSGTDIYYAGTEDGKVFYQAPGENWPERSTGLPTGVRINNISVDPNNPAVAYVMLGGGGIHSVYRTTNAGNSWQPFGASGAQALPEVPAHTMVIDKRSLPGAPSGLIYVGTDLGVYVTTDNGASFRPLGQGLPVVPVVDLQFDSAQEQLLAATQGRGAWLISTARSGPFITSSTPGTPRQGPLTEMTVTFNSPINPATFTTAANVQPRLEWALGLASTAEHRTARARDLFATYLRRDPGPGIGGFADLLAQPNGEARVTAILVASAEYFNNPDLGNGSNSAWLNRAYLDLFQRPATDAGATARLNALTAGTKTRQQVADELVADNEYRRVLAAGLLARFVGASYSAPPPADDARINDLVARLAGGASVQSIIASLLASEEAYREMGSALALGAGQTARALAFGNFTGRVDGFGTPIPDLAVALASNVVRVYRGRPGGGYDTTPALTLPLPSGAAATDLVAADFNGDGMDDLAVANGGLSGAGSLSVFLNNRTSTGAVSFGARSDLNGGNRPAGLVAANIDPGAALDLATVSSAPSGVSFGASVLLGDGAGGFGAPFTFPVGSIFAAPGEITGPTGLALADVAGNPLPDLIVAGTNGVAVLTNTTALAGFPTFSLPTARLSDLAATSVAAGRIDTDGSTDIVFTTTDNDGAVVVLQNRPTGFAPTTLDAGPSPRSVQVRDLDGDGRDEIVVVNAAPEGTVAVLRNTTEKAASGADAVTFAPALRYATNADTPVAARLADTNQDGVPDVAVAHQNSESVSVLLGGMAGKLRTASDVNWLQFVTRELYKRAASAAEITGLFNHVAARSLVTLSGPDGTRSPLAIESLDPEGLSFRLTFDPVIRDGTYTLIVGPSQSGATVKDLVDRDGTYLNVGNAMNQNRNLVNGEFPGDRFSTRAVVTTSDTGRYLFKLYNDLLGRDPNGRDPDTASFIAFQGVIEPGHQQALTAFASALAGSAEARMRDVDDAYFRFLGRRLTPLSPSEPTVAAWLQVFASGQGTQFDLWVALVASGEYFNNKGGTNAAWVNGAFLDLLGRPAGPGNAFVAALDAGSMTREQAARAILLSDEGLARVVAGDYQQLLSRNPYRAPDPARDEPALWRALLRQGPAGPGQLTPLERFRAALAASPEHVLLAGNSDQEWIVSAYRRLLRRPGVDSTSPGVAAQLSGLLSLYTPQRQAVATTIANSPEFRARVFSRYHVTNLSTTGRPYVPTATDLAVSEGAYQSQGGRLEAVLAGVLARDDYERLEISRNTVWLNRLYSDFLRRPRGSENQAALTYLNSAPPNNPAELANRRRQVALGILNSAEYRRALVAVYFNTILGRAATAGDLDAWVNQMNAGLKQEGLIGILYSTPEGFLNNT